VSRRYAAGGQVALAGYAQSKIERRASVPLGALALDTARRAIADAGLSLAQIDGVANASLLPSFGAHGLIDGVSIVTANWLAEHLDLSTRWIAGYAGWGTLTGSMILAVNAIASGAATHVLVFRALSNPPGRYHDNAIAEAADGMQWTVPYGMWAPPAKIALPYMEYLQRYGAGREAMATLVVQLRQNVQRMPWAYWYGKPLSVDDYMNARMVADPISVLDCDIPVEGVAAFVLTRGERARDLPHKPVYVAGFAQGRSQAEPLMLDDIMQGGKALCETLWESAGIGRDEIDVPQIYDGFSPLVYFWLESLGYCPQGEAHRFIQDGAIAADGELPLISGGGAIGNGRMHGVPQLLECYLQLSQRAGERQLRRAEVGLACHAMPQSGAAMIFTADSH
jgi:acetyl-CoA acetyltransferase